MKQMAPDRSSPWVSLGCSWECSICALSGLGALLASVVKLVNAAGAATPAACETLAEKTKHVILSCSSYQLGIQDEVLWMWRSLIEIVAAAVDKHPSGFMKQVLEYMRQWWKSRHCGMIMFSCLWKQDGSLQTERSPGVLGHLSIVWGSVGERLDFLKLSSQKSWISSFPCPTSNLSISPNGSTCKVKMNSSASLYFCFYDVR